MRIRLLWSWGRKISQGLTASYKAGNEKFKEQFGFEIKDTTLDNLIDYMHVPKDSSSLAVTRILFGLAMLFDIPDERGGASMDNRWGDLETCHFPLLPFLQPLLLPYMALVYAAMWFGALGIMLGYKYRFSAGMFTLSYWYLFLVEKSFWNNHSYLFGIVALLLNSTDAACYWSIDAHLDPTKRKSSVPYWNYFVLKYQFFILYFMAGMKKGTAEWLTGYSVQDITEHWVFDPFKWFLTESQTNHIVVHWFVFVFDLTVAFWMMWSYSRNVAMAFCALFHLMNSRLFRIGMFPWVCLATMPLFYPFDWPKTAICIFNEYYRIAIDKIHAIINECKTRNVCLYKSDQKDEPGTSEANENVGRSSVDDEDIKHTTEKITYERKRLNDNEGNGFEEPNAVVEEEELASGRSERAHKKLTIYFIIFHILSQIMLPYSHFITKGYNNWTNGLYGYSWDMMVHTWNTQSIIVKVIDNDNNREMYIDHNMYTINDRWTRHGDMVLQYAECLKNNLKYKYPETKNISIYIDVWCSLNGRFVQRMFDPNVDLLKVYWSPFRPLTFLMPLLDEAVHWRNDLDEIRKEVHSWNNYSDVAFFADFPGYYQEKFIPLELLNVTLVNLQGTIAYEPEVTVQHTGYSYKLEEGEHVDVTAGTFHKVLNIGKDPAFYMYTFLNETEINITKNMIGFQSKFPVYKELYKRMLHMTRFVILVVDNILQMFMFPQCG